ncbi:MAG: lysophospholipid acyltransferase family protein [Actinomycetota bacterium]
MGLFTEIETVARGWRWAHRPLAPATAGSPEGRPREFPTAWARTPAGRLAREMVQRLGLFPLFQLEIDTSVSGVETLDDLKAPVIFIANHSSHLDTPAILSALPYDWRRRTAVGAAADYFFDVWWRALGTPLAFNTFPVARSGARRVARLARELLDGGWSVVLYPEGTRTPDGWLGPLRAGAAWLAIEAGVPVVPIAIWGSYQAMPRDRGWPIPGRPPVRVRFGDPLHPAPGERASELVQRLQQALATTLDEETGTWWEAMRRQARGEAPDHAGPQAAEWRRLWEASRPISRARSSSPWPNRRSKDGS